MLRAALLESGETELMRKTTKSATGHKTLEYASFVGDGDFLYVLAPLYPTRTTIGILARQLVYVTIISLLVAFALSYYLSILITRPITAITKSAKKMADGEFGVSFAGSRYSEVESLASTLSAASAEIERARGAQRDIIANVSHDLKTPLTMIRSYAELIQDISGDDPEKREEHLAVIIRETDRLNALITEFQNISKLKSGEEQVEFAKFSLSDLVETVADTYRSFAEQNGYELAVSTRGACVVRGDESRIAQVLTNLLSNAIKYGGKAGIITMKAQEKKGGRGVRVEVADRGVGIPKEEIPLIWTRYYKSSTNYRRSDDSAGLGLSIVKEILMLHGAKYGVESKPGRGSSFWFELKSAGASERPARG
jgi:signal transduction histidine kinase